MRCIMKWRKETQERFESKSDVSEEYTLVSREIQGRLNIITYEIPLSESVIKRRLIVT